MSDDADGLGFMGAAGPSGTSITTPGTTTDKAIVRWADLTGTAVDDSSVLVEDDGRISTLTDPTGLTDAATKNYVDTAVAAVNVGGAAQNSFLVAGGQVVWASAYTFSVSAATYFINGILYSSAPASATLGAAHATLDRIDVIAVDDTGSVVVIPGTAAAQPSEPDIDPGTQLKLSIVLVTHATTQPVTASSTLLYGENTGGPGEWNWTASGASINVNSSTNPRTGTKCIEGTTVVAGVYAQGAIPSGTLDPNASSLLVFYLRSKAQWNNNRGLQVSLRAANVLVGTAVTIARSGTWGFDSSQTASYQQIAIPVAQFAVPAGTTITQIRIADFGGSIGFYLDDVSFQGGATTQPSTGITQAQADARYRKLDTPLVLSSSADVTGVLPLANVASLPASIGCTWDGGGSVITAGSVRYVQIPFAHLITAATMLADVAGDAVVDVWRDVYASYPPVVGDSITASAKPTLTAAISSTDSTLTGWSKTGAAGDVYAFSLTSAATITVLRVSLTVVRI